MPKQCEDYTTDENGDESHPAFGLASIHRIRATPGEVLFQSDVRHSEYIEVTLSEATRHRELKHDWVFPRKVLVKFAMSMSQFASFVASGGDSGVPVTIEYDHGDRPGLTMESRLALTAAEVKTSAHAAFERIKVREAEYEAALSNKAPAAERKKALANLKYAIANAASNVDYAAKRLTEHAEDVVEKSRADIEAMAIAAAQNGQLSAETIRAITDGS